MCAQARAQRQEVDDDDDMIDGEDHGAAGAGAGVGEAALGDDGSEVEEEDVDDGEDTDVRVKDGYIEADTNEVRERKRNRSTPVSDVCCFCCTGGGSVDVPILVWFRPDVVGRAHLLQDQRGRGGQRWR